VSLAIILELIRLMFNGFIRLACLLWLLLNGTTKLFNVDLIHLNLLAISTPFIVIIINAYSQSSE